MLTLKMRCVLLLTTVFMQAACTPSLPTGDMPISTRLGVTQRITLAPEGYSLSDLRFDERHLYITNEASQLHILERSTLTPLRTIAVEGSLLTLDLSHHRLYVAPGTQYVPPEQPAQIAIFDTNSFEKVGTLPGRYISVDPIRHRVYTGVPLTLETEQAMATQTVADGIRLFDGATLAELAVGSQPGIPVYNAIRDELLIVAYTVYTANAETLAVERNLLPELAAQEPRWCTGCTQAVGATLFAAPAAPAPTETPLLLLSLSTAGGGKGAGLEELNRWLSADTLEPVDALPSLQQSCGSQLLLRSAVNGQIFRSLTYSRYQVAHNLRIENRQGEPQRQLDGLELLYVDSQTRQGVAAASGSHNLLLDLPTVEPIGVLPAFCVLGADGQTDGADTLLYGAAGAELLVLTPTTAGREPPVDDDSAAAAVDLQAESVVVPDQTKPRVKIALSVDGQILHSADGGQVWQPAQIAPPGWLPTDLATVALEPAPAYAEKRMLFFAGEINGQSGLGVWRSTDGGATWRPAWKGLDHLRVSELHFSPNFVSDETLWATANFSQIAPTIRGEQGASEADASLQTGRSLWKSTNGGEEWHLVAQAVGDEALPAPQP